jgi:hypothetical protein
MEAPHENAIPQARFDPGPSFSRRLGTYAGCVLAAATFDFLRDTFVEQRSWQFFRFDEALAASSVYDLVDAFSLGHFTWGFIIAMLYKDVSTAFVWHVMWESAELQGRLETYSNSAGDLFVGWLGSLLGIAVLRKHNGRVPLQWIQAAEFLNHFVSSFVFIQWAVLDPGLQAEVQNWSRIFLCVASAACFVAASSWLNTLHSRENVFTYTAATTCAAIVGIIFVGPRALRPLRDLQKTSHAAFVCVLAMTQAMSTSLYIYGLTYLISPSEKRA